MFKNHSHDDEIPHPISNASWKRSVLNMPIISTFSFSPVNKSVGVNYVARFRETTGISYEKVIEELAATFNVTSNDIKYLGSSGLQIGKATIEGKVG
jgi:hypothetical protein